MNIKSFTLALTALAATSTSFAQDLKIQNFLAKPEHFGVTSTLIEGDKEVLLVNAQFSKSEALRIAADILDSGKTLKTIFVSYGDPDFYFGLDVFKQYFPNVQIIATPETVKHIQDTQALKVAYWGPKMADTPTTKDRNEVVQALESIKSLKPNVVVPAHMKEGAAEGLDAVNFSIDYLKQYEKAAKVTKTSTTLIQMMQKEYPTLSESSSLELGAKVVKGEMQWP